MQSQQSRQKLAFPHSLFSLRCPCLEGAIETTVRFVVGEPKGLYKIVELSVGLAAVRVLVAFGLSSWHCPREPFKELSKVEKQIVITPVLLWAAFGCVNTQRSADRLG